MYFQFFLKIFLSNDIIFYHSFFFFQSFRQYFYRFIDPDSDTVIVHPLHIVVKARCAATCSDDDIAKAAHFMQHLFFFITKKTANRIPGVRLVGTAADKASVLSFVLRGYTTDEVGQALNEEGIAVRTGHHCAQPILRRFGLEATVRPSLAFYNTCEEVDRLIAVVRRLSAARARLVALGPEIDRVNPQSRALEFARANQILPGALQ